MKDEKQFVIDTLKTVYGVSNIAESEFISDEDPEQVDDDKVKSLFAKYDKDKVEKTKTKFFDDGAKAREKKLKSELETSIKTKFGITEFDADDLDALIDHAVSKKPVTNIADLTPEAIEALPHVIKLKNDLNKKIADKETEFNTKLSEREKAEAKAKLFTKASGLAVTRLMSKNPVLPADADKAKRRIQKDLIEELEVYGFLEQDGEIIPLDKDGKQVTTENDVPVTFDDLVDRLSLNFDFSDVPPPKAKESSKSNPPAKVPGKEAPQVEPYKGKIPDNEEEYLKLITDRSFSVEERASIQRQYKKKKGIV